MASGVMREKVWPVVRVLLVHVVLAGGLIGGIVALLVDKLRWLDIDFHGKSISSIEPAGLVLALIVIILVSVLLVLGAWRLLERKKVGALFHPVDEDARHGRALMLGLGVGLGAVIVVYLILLISGAVKPQFGFYAVDAGVVWIALGWVLASSVLAPLSEEVLYRGYWFQNLRRGWGLGVAAVVPGLLFGGIHLLNPDATLIGALNIALSGVLFVLGMVWFRSLWFAIGWHAGWNFCQFFLTGLPNSGFSPEDLGLAGTTLLQSELTGPEWWTGGAFGMEGSPAGTLVYVIVFVVLAVLWRKGHFSHEGAESTDAIGSQEPGHE